jgi:monomeric isocitrate dehydrogenase
MITSQQNYSGQSKTILKYGQNFQNVIVKVAKGDVLVDSSSGKRILKAGTVLSKDGKIVDGSTITNDKAFGLVYNDKDFTNSNGIETVAVTIFGFIDSKALPATVPDAAKTAMKMLYFL